MITKSELKKRRETANKVRDQLGHKAILNKQGIDQKYSQYPLKIRNLALASSALKQWGSEDRSSEDIRLYYEYLDCSPCSLRTVDYAGYIEEAIDAMECIGLDSLALRIRRQWKEVQELAGQADDLIPVFRRQLTKKEIDERDFSKEVRRKVESARRKASILGGLLEKAVKYQIEEFDLKLSAISGKAREIQPNDLMTLTVAVQKFDVSKSTLRRSIKDGRLKNYNTKNESKSSLVMISESEVAKHWPRK